MGALSELKTKTKAIALLSGGLDSRLAVKMMLDQGVDVLALNFVTCFCTCTAKSSCRSEAKKASEEFDIGLKVINHTEQLLEAVKKPKYGYGRGLNPCLDCRIAMFKEAAEVMEKENASFIITGEVLGERPMSQRLDAIQIIERDSGLKGKVLRPLSAKLFQPTDVENQGLVDRQSLLSITGRSRKPQIELAQELGLNDYPCPAGGCLLTDTTFAKRLKALLEINLNPANKQLNLLKVGRHFLIDDHLVVVGRNKEENQRINALKEEDDLILTCQDFEGPTTIIKVSQSTSQPVNQSTSTLTKAAALTARYSQGRDKKELVVNCVNGYGGQVIKVDLNEGYQLAESLTRY